MSGEKELDRLASPNKLTIYHRGPSLDRGPLPSVFYFALSGEESLSLDPYNSPVRYLQEAHGIRAFSFDVPAHGEGLDSKTAMSRWADFIKNDYNFVEEFVSRSMENIDSLIDQGLIDPGRISVAGLSRGGFMAAHLAAKDKRIRAILAFAPLTTLDTIEWMQGYLTHPLVRSLPLETLTEEIAGRPLRFYIGNRDVLVKTEKCFEFIHKLADASYQKGIRSPPAELIITPSIGYKGHGTAPEIFEDGTKWLKNKLIT